MEFESDSFGRLYISYANLVGPFDLVDLGWFNYQTCCPNENVTSTSTTTSTLPPDPATTSTTGIPGDAIEVVTDIVYDAETGLIKVRRAIIVIDGVRASELPLSSYQTCCTTTPEPSESSMSSSSESSSSFSSESSSSITKAFNIVTSSRFDDNGNIRYTLGTISGIGLELIDLGFSDFDMCCAVEATTTSAPTTTSFNPSDEYIEVVLSIEYVNGVIKVRRGILVVPGIQIITNNTETYNTCCMTTTQAP